MNFNIPLPSYTFY